MTEDDLKQRIESHCVNYEMLVADDFDAYFIDRAKKLLSLIEKAMGKPVSDRNGPHREFCVSDFRQNQEYYVINVHDGAYSPWLHLSRKVGTVCAPYAA